MSERHPRIARERRTIEAMIDLYCGDVHAANGSLCAECKGLLDYARERLDRCPYQGGKTTCAQCSVHCYRPEMRERIRAVMRYAGPRMILRHPIMAAAHLFDRLRREPVKPDEEDV